MRRRIVTERASGSGPAAGARTGKRTDADAAGAGGEEPPPPEEAGAALPTPGEGVDDIEAAREHAKYLEGVVKRYEAGGFFGEKVLRPATEVPLQMVLDSVSGVF